MTPQALEATAAQANGKVTPGPRDAVMDPIEQALTGDGTSAPVSDAEAEYMRSGLDAPSADTATQPTTESTEEEGAEVDGEELAESTGEEPKGDEAGLEEQERVWKDALKMANGDPKKALEIARVALGVEDDGKPTTESGPELIAKAIEAEVAADVERFYEARVDEKAGPRAESKALTQLLAARETALVQKVGQILEQFEGKLGQKAKVTEASKALWKEHPGWKRDEAALLRFIAEVPARRSLPPLDAYELFLAKQAKRAAPVDAKKAAAVSAAATRKAFGTSAQASAGGRPSGPTQRKPLTTEQREVLVARAMPGRLRMP